MRRIINSFIAAAIVAGGLAVSDTASAATRIAGINMTQACNHRYAGDRYSGLVFAKVENPRSAYSWACWSSGGWNAYRWGGLDLNWCRTLYGSRAYASATSSKDPYSWGCYR